MSHDRRSAPERDRLFNAETCRAFRQYARSRPGMAVGALVVAIPVLNGIGARLSSPLLLELLALGYMIAVIGTLTWLMVRSDFPMSPVPALAAGRAPRDWAIIIAAPVGVYRMMVSSTSIPLPIVAVGCLAVGGLLFREFGNLTETYPPEQPMED